ncbi:nuclear transport factor 2 family protein [Sinorhizobium meliloti]|uniref:nuclear transport factor 2 family protein n=1 Tax=Rhizobium meliloti TaxID=382 RepID=UPI000FDA5FA2|nr:nuclear transport factor 2 family protein [Sinorhizobium meliloti]MDX0661183.1 nuclear transport factor 2 family protein [Sinorhizobium medicae]MDE3823656.1 nuclear transport factor 2 family protein [Sinorhizobium meliloti]RVH99627.1 nuclear transport factor 2 family protein [Sinorhizobium meliloti]RVK43473.1 nuclear transport factor 2 family protein [Sinorhizobium meliloti]RVM37589.1 nuclear transport factor 2 family protein [Sinorhizobium meliloti]
MSLKNFMRAGVFAALAVVSLTGAAQAGPAQNKELVIKAVAGLFIDHDPAVVDEYWSQKYIQHNPLFPSGRDVIKQFASNPPPGFKYEMGAVAADGDFVMVHGRYTGFGPKPMIAVDMFRIEKGKIAEHWDVLQEEVPASQTKSGNPMFVPGM